MKASNLLQRWAGKLVMLGLRLHDFTAVFGAKDSNRLAALLESDDRAQPYRDVYGLHELRWALFDPNQRTDISAIDPTRPQALVLSLVYDGNLSDILDGILDRAGARIRQILEFCHGFDAQTDVIDFLKRHATPSGYLFRDLGPLLLPADPDPQLEPDPEPDPTRAEIEEAYVLQQRFERFYATHSQDDAKTLRDAYLKEFADEGFPLPLTSFERRSNDEEAWTRHMIDDARKQQDKAARASSDGLIRRGVHAKGHGLLHAKFQVIAAKYPFGLFAEPQSYEAVLRPSNGAPALQKDRDFDARGLALGVFLPRKPTGTANAPQFVLPSEGQSQHRQDFVLMNRSTFFAANIRRLGMWSKTLHNERGVAKALGVLGLVAGPKGITELWTFGRTILSKLDHPLNAEFHSTTPYLLGEHHVAKFSVRPRDPERFQQLSTQTSSAALSLTLRESLRDRPIVLEFFVHVFPDGIPKGRASLVDVVEDGTVDWNALGAQKFHVANIEIGAQDPTTIERMNQGEFQRFSPWNALREHRPIGNLNRARLAAYRASQRHRAVELRHSEEAGTPKAAE